MDKLSPKVARHLILYTKETVDFANWDDIWKNDQQKAINTIFLEGLAVIRKNQHRFKSLLDYPRRSRAKIVEAYFRQASTTDYSWIQGRYIDFRLRKHSKSIIHADENFHQHQMII